MNHPTAVNPQQRSSSAFVAQVERLVVLVSQAHMAEGHENYGPLSLDSGFLPERPLLESLPAAFAAWDQAAAALPHLYSTLRLRDELESLPVLDAHALPDTALQRAATVLSILAHAYRQVVFDNAVTLPAALARPWSIVCQRLGRDEPLMTYADLILCNWRRRDRTDRRLVVSLLDLLVPAVGTEEERVFYLTQTEITAQLAPLLKHYLVVCGALENRQWARAESAIVAMQKLVHGATHRSLRALTAAEGQHRIDPVVWAKTVAPLAVSTSSQLPGPSGTSNPALHLLDEITGRREHDSRLGQESQALRSVFPPSWQMLFGLLQYKPDVPQQIAESKQPSLQDAWQAMVAAYAGPNGLLERHRIKVYGFIEVAFKVGRSVTIGGFAGPFAARAWDEVDDALVAAKRERSSALRQVKSPPQTRADDWWARLAARPLPVWSLAELYRGVLDADQNWIRLRGYVVTLQPIASKHPGGPDILRLQRGRDASSVFARVGHTSTPAVLAQLQHCIIARLRPLPAAHGVWQKLERSVDALIEVREAFRIETALLGKKLTATEHAEDDAPSALALWHARDAIARLRGSLIHWALRDHVLALIHSESRLLEKPAEWESFNRLEAALLAHANAEPDLRRLVTAHAALDRCMLGLAQTVARQFTGDEHAHEALARLDWHAVTMAVAELSRASADALFAAL